MRAGAEESASSLSSTGSSGLAVAMCVCGAGQARGAIDVFVGRCDGGETLQPFESEGQDNQLAAERELLTERLAERRRRRPSAARDEPEVAAQHHPQIRIVEALARAESRER